MTNIINISINCVKNAITCITDNDKNAIAEVRRLETEVDDLEDKYRENHIKRMSQGECNTVAGIVFLDIIGNLERVTDHANNLADYREAENKRKVVLNI